MEPGWVEHTKPKKKKRRTWKQVILLLRLQCEFGDLHVAVILIYYILNFIRSNTDFLRWRAIAQSLCPVGCNSIYSGLSMPRPVEESPRFYPAPGVLETPELNHTCLNRLAAASAVEEIWMSVSWPPRGELLGCPPILFFLAYLFVR